jgi:2-isopropylmalate synthase
MIGKGSDHLIQRSELMEPSVLLYDTTLRDGTQGEDINFSAEEKIKIAQRLDEIGIHYIEGGWPGSNPRDKRFFDLAKSMQLKTARLTAFGSTRRPNTTPDKDQNVIALLESDTPAVAIFGKSWNLHVEQVMKNSLEENLAMIRETVGYLKEKDREVIYDAEHFFDGYKEHPDYAMQTLFAAMEGGADSIVLCDTNGGSLPFEIEGVTRTVFNILDEKYPPPAGSGPIFELDYSDPLPQDESGLYRHGEPSKTEKTVPIRQRNRQYRADQFPALCW